MSRDATIEVYQARAGDYAGLTAELHEMKQLKAFAAALPRGGRVLDFGCGPGFHAGWLAEQGFDVEAWDGSAEMVALAQGQRACCMCPRRSSPAFWRAFTGPGNRAWRFISP